MSLSEFMKIVLSFMYFVSFVLIVLFYFAFQQQKLQKPSPKKRKGHFFKLRFGSGRKISAPTGMHQT